MRLHYVFKKFGFYFHDAPKNIVDFGCGPGTAQRVYESTLKNTVLPTDSWINCDSHSEALDLAKIWNTNTKLNTKYIQSKTIPKAKTNNDLLIASYSLCEIQESKVLIESIKEYETLVLLEPGQKKESKALIDLRNELLEKHSFYAYAPCPHQKACPMTNEKKHWCHDHVKKPGFLNVYKLPFSQDKLNLSYMILSKKVPKKCQNLGRIVGDLRREKGKTRVSTCFDGTLSTLSWLKKTKLSMDINRGDLIRWADDFEKKGHEIRISKALKRVDEESLFDDSSCDIFQA